MKKILALIIFIAFTTSYLKAQSNWITYKIDDHFSVKLPDQPKPGAGIATASMSKDSVACIIVSIDLAKTDPNIDSATLAAAKEMPEFVEQMKAGMQGAFSNVQLSDIKQGQWNGLTTFSTNGIDKKNVKYDLLMIMYSTKLYMFATGMRPKNTGTDHDIFFNSITFK